MSMGGGDALTLLLGGGAVATIGAFFKGVQALQSGARARERDTMRGLVNQRNEAWIDRDNSQDIQEWWRNRAGDLEYRLRSAGVEVPPAPPMPTPKKFKPIGEKDEV